MLTRYDIENFLTSSLHTDDFMYEFNHDINDEEFIIITDYLPNTGDGDIVFEVE